MRMQAPPVVSTRRAIHVALVGVIIAAALAASVLGSVDWDASSLLRVGEENTAILEYVEGQLGAVLTVPELGHDGKYFFIQANDPLLLDPASHAEVIDRPVYRSQRMLYPFFASLGGLLEGWAIVWGLLVVNLAAIGLGTWAAARLAISLGATPWLGLAFALNPGMLFELIIDGGGVIAWALAVLGVWLITEGRYRGAVVAIIGATLAREAMILVALGVAARLWRKDRVRAIWMVAAPAAAALVWGLWVRFRLAVPLLTSESEEIGLPFVGLARAFSRWADDPGRNLIFGLAVIAFLLVIALQAMRRPSYIAYSTLGFIILAPLLTRQVWLNYFDITRAVAPVFTSFALVLFAADKGTGQTARR